MSLGRYLRKQRDGARRPRQAVAHHVGISTEHLRRIEADNSRPSPGVLRDLLSLYDTGDKARQQAWLLLARSHLPEEVRKHVSVHPVELVESIIAAAMEWAELYYETDKDDQKYLQTHIKSKLE